MLLLLLNYVVLRALWKIDVHLISTLVNIIVIIIIIIIIIFIIIIIIIIIINIIIIVYSYRNILKLYDVQPGIQGRFETF